MEIETRGIKSVPSIAIALFFTFFSVVFFVHLMADLAEGDYIYDALDYWNIGKSFFESGHFSFSNLSQDNRGVIFPLFLGVCGQLNIKLGIKCAFPFLSSLFVAALLTASILFIQYVLVAQGVSDRWKGVGGYIRGVLPGFLLLLFFKGIFIYPLTDLYAALTAILAAACVCLGKEREGRTGSLVWYFIAGGLAYITYNIRAIYIIAAAAFLIIIFIVGRKNGKCFTKGMCLYIMGGGYCGFPTIGDELPCISDHQSMDPESRLVFKTTFLGIADVKV